MKETHKIIDVPHFCKHKKRDQQFAIAEPLYFLVPEGGIEPPWAQGPEDFESESEPMKIYNDIS